MWAGNGYDSILSRICTQIPAKYFLKMRVKITNTEGDKWRKTNKSVLECAE
jgi:hypothetical protein